MKPSFFIAILFLLFISCKKDKNPTVDEGKLYDVSFGVSLFRQEIVPIGSSGADSKISAIRNTGSISSTADVDPSDPESGVNHIYYRVFQNNENIRTIEQTRGDADFGKIIHQLPKGTYRIVFIASKEKITVEAVRGGRFVLFPMPGQDIFYETLSLNVEGQLNRVISLNRVAALLQLKTDDNIPYDVEEIILDVNSGQLPNVMELLLGEAKFSEDFSSEPLVTKISESQYGKPFEVSVYILGADKNPNITVSLLARNSAHQQLYSAAVNNITIERGKQTNLKGSLFINSAVDGAVIKLPSKTWEIKGTVNF